MRRLSDLAIIAGAALLATGGFFGGTIDGIWSDLLPAFAASVLFLLALVIDRRNSWPRGAAGMVALAVLSLLVPADPLESVNLTFACVALMAGARLKNDDACRRAVLFASIPLLVFGLYQRYILFPEIAPIFHGEARDRLLSGRIFSAFMVPAQYSAWIAIVLVIALAIAMIDRFRFLARVLIPVLVLSLYFAGSFSGVVAVIIGALLLFGRARARIILSIAVVIVLGVAITRWNEVLGWNPITMRTSTWWSTIRGIIDSPIIGHGARSFETLYPTYYVNLGGDEVLHPHCWPLKIAFEYGLLGLGAWLYSVSGLLAPIRDRSFRAAAAAFFVASLLDISDLSMTLRSLGYFFLGASLNTRR